MAGVNTGVARGMSRRKFLRAMVGGLTGVGLTAAAGGVYATQIEPNAVELTRHTIRLPNMDPAFDGFTIVQVSDMHMNEWMTLGRMLTIVQQVNALNPDVIALTGDFIGGYEAKPGIFDQITQFLSEFKASEGIYAVLGNHDHWIGVAPVSKAIADAGTVRLLSNEHTVIRRNGAALYFAGVDDIVENCADLMTTLRGIPHDAAAVLLAHEPDFADVVARDGRIGLQLSGHTHGGQVRLPFVGPLVLPQMGHKYIMGLYPVSAGSGEMRVYVNRGVGMVAPYVRFNCRPEITHLTLTV